jgi:hypothetical protein
MNRVTELADLDPLAGFKKLVYLTLIGNPVTSKEVRLMGALAAFVAAPTLTCCAELPLLGHLAVPDGALPRLCQGARRGAQEGQRAVRDGRRAD